MRVILVLVSLVLAMGSHFVHAGNSPLIITGVKNPNAPILPPWMSPWRADFGVTRPDGRVESQHFEINGTASQLQIGRPNVLIGQPNVQMGQPNTAIGQPNIFIGRPNTGIGKPNIFIGAPNAGIGKPNVQIGQPNIQIGQPNLQIGKPNVSIGRPNVFIGAPNTDIGRPNVTIGQPNISIGGQQSSQSQLPTNGAPAVGGFSPPTGRK